MTDPQLARPTEAIHAVSRILTAAAVGGPEAIERTLLREARDFFGVTSAQLVRTRGDRPARSDPAEVVHARTLLFLPLLTVGAASEVLVLADEDERDFTYEEMEIGVAFVDAAAASLEQLRLSEELAEQVARLSALARSAQALNESLDLPRLLTSIAREATAILEADVAAVWRGNGRDGVVVEAVHGFPPEVIGFRLEPGEGLAGRVAQLGRPLLLEDYGQIVPPDSPFTNVECVIGVPMQWEGELHGVLAVGYTRAVSGVDQNIQLLETFGQLASIARRNASVHAGLAHAARTDGLTGCLNHAALHEALRREIERARRSGQPLSLALLDLDRFKQVNERHGHLVGDEVLRRVGRTLTGMLRPYDLVARYGGDEFAIVATDSGESDACDIAERAVARLGAALADFAGDWPPGPEGRRATVGVAEWGPGLSATELIAQADRALLYGKREGAPGSVAASALPESFRPARFRRESDPEIPSPRQPEDDWPAAGRQQLDRLRRRTRALAFANALGARTAAMTSSHEILETVVSELARAFGWSLVAALRVRDDDWVEAVASGGGLIAPGTTHTYSQPRSAGLIGRSLRERQVVVTPDVTREPDYRPSDLTEGICSEAVVPLRVDGVTWGALNVEDVEPDAFDEDAVRLLQAVAEQTGAALEAALRYERLERDGAAG